MKNGNRVLLALSAIALLAAVPALSKVSSFSAHLNGRNEVPPAETKATGEARFDLSADQSVLQYRITTGMIENVTSASIYIGAPTENGEAVATLYGPMAPGGGKKAGLLATGAIAATNLTGSLAGHPLSDLVAQMQSGRAYVNITTDAGAGGSGEKSGNFTNGEIRGQIR